MPTPFTHLEIAQRLIDDPVVPEAIRSAAANTAGAFLLGNIAADARVGNGSRREDTHFYRYGEPINLPPWREMLRQYPSLNAPHSTAQRVFIAGYAAHLSVDEYWTRNLTHPYFAHSDWSDQRERFYMLHILLISMDERDLDKLESWQPAALHGAEPNHWLPFASDDDLRYWQHLIYDQIKPDGQSRTLEIFGGRINKTPEAMRAILDDDEQLRRRLFDHVPRTLLADVESGMYTYARQQMVSYWRESA